jgi:hypothetical protein
VADDNEQQSEGRHPFGEPLRDARARVRGRLQPGKIEHRVREDNSKAAAEYLHDDVRASFAPGQGTPHRLDERDRRIEMRSAHGTQKRNQGRQHRNGCPGVRKKRDRGIPASQSLGHDPRAHDRRGEESRPDALGYKAPHRIHRFSA